MNLCNHSIIKIVQLVFIHIVVFILFAHTFDSHFSLKISMKYYDIYSL